MSDAYPHIARARFLLHIGPPKTGTTSLQELVLPRIDGLVYLGKPWFNPDVPYDKCVNLHRAVDSVTKAPLGHFDADMARRAVEDWLTHSPAFAAASGRPLCLLSEERLTLSDVVSQVEIAARLSQVFPGAHAVYVRREPVAALLSLYKWLYARAWIHDSFSRWIDKALRPGSTSTGAVGLRYYDWAALKRGYGAHFPMHHAEMGDMHRDVHRFMADYLGEAGPLAEAGAALLAETRHTVLNVSRNRAVSELHRGVKLAIRGWNKLPFSKLDEKPEYLGEGPMWDRLEAPLRRLPLGQGKFRVTDQDRERIARYYAERGN
ncbi:hypothetical protein [Paracoccus pacificus]|uniref:Sulfotransferase family protein n=1 Tax=Paracoccus pacificus TaxID=1463598 RepID=A0ABW4R6K1_9RHOB